MTYPYVTSLYFAARHSMSADLYFITDSFFSSYLCFRRLISELAKRNSTKIGHILGSNCDLKTHIQNLGYRPPPPTNRGPKNHLLWPTSQLNGKINGLYLRNETWHRQSVKCVDNYKGSSTSSRNVMNFGPQTASNSTCILPTLRKFCILFHCQASHTEISTHNSTRLCQTADSKLR